MKSLWKIALGGLLLSAFAIILGVAFVSGTLVFTNAMGGAFDDIKHLVAGIRGRIVYETGDLDAGIWSAGQVQGLIHDIPTVAQLIERIMCQARELLSSLGKEVAAE